MIRIAQAASSEVHTKDNPGIWGTPPNQLRTGVTKDRPEGNLDGELNIIPFYPSNWRAVFRAKDPKIAEKMAWVAERAVANGSQVGYGQNWITEPYPMSGLFDALYAMAEPDPWKILYPVNCTCATLIGAAAYTAGVYEPKLRLLNTHEQEQILMSTGKFVELKDPELLSAAVGVKRGDIFWREGHTMIALDSDYRVEGTPVIISDCWKCNLRKGPGIEHGIIREMTVGEITIYIGSAEDEDGDVWARLNVGGTYGYVAAKYVKDLPKATVTWDVWLRSDAGKDYKELIVIPQGTDICYLTGNTKKVGFTTWYECLYAGYRGYASGKYIKE